MLYSAIFNEISCHQLLNTVVYCVLLLYFVSQPDKTSPMIQNFDVLASLFCFKDVFNPLLVTNFSHPDQTDAYTLIRDNITFTPTDIPSTINTHNIELQMVKVHLNNTKHITIANVYIPPRDSTSTHHKTADKDIQHCIQHITTIPHSVLTKGVNPGGGIGVIYPPHVLTWGDNMSFIPPMF